MPTGAMNISMIKPGTYRRSKKAVTEFLPPVPTAGGTATQVAAPAVFRPIGRPATDVTGILLPVFFWPRANRAGSIHKPGAPKIPAIPAAVFPASGLAPFPFVRAKPLRLALIFCPPEQFDGFVARRAGGRFNNRMYRTGGKPIES